MKKFFRWLGFVVAGLVGIALPTDAADISEGERLAHLAGCTGCHKQDLSGLAVLDIPRVVRFVAPTLTRIVPPYSDAELVTLLRTGVKRDGASMYFMPSEMLRHLDDREVSRLIAWLRTQPERDGITGKTAARNIAASPGAVPSFDAGDALSRGRHYALSFCSECHGQDFKGNEFAHAPPLAVAKGYTAEAFSKLLHEGVALGGRELELMSPTARGRFAVMTPDETSDLFGYLQSRD